MTEYFHLLDPTQFPSHILEKPPFFSIVKGMPKFNALLAAYVWNHAVTKIVNMSTYVSPVTGESYEALLARKLPKADGTPSDTYAISKQFMALIHFYSACVLDASATNQRNMRHVFDDNLALYTTWEEKNIDWRSDFRFSDVTNMSSTMSPTSNRLPPTFLSFLPMTTGTHFANSPCFLQLPCSIHVLSTSRIAFAE